MGHTHTHTEGRDQNKLYTPSACQYFGPSPSALSQRSARRVPIFRTGYIFKYSEMEIVPINNGGARWRRQTWPRAVQCCLVTYRGLGDKGQGRSRTNILKPSSDYPEVCGCVAIFTQGAVCTGRLFTVPWCRDSGSGRRTILSGGLFYFGIFSFFFFLIEDRRYTAAERFSSTEAGMDS